MQITIDIGSSQSRIINIQFKMKNIQRLELPAAADMHVHLRQSELMDLVVPTVQQGGVDTVFVYEFSVLEQIEYTKANKM